MCYVIIAELRQCLLTARLFMAKVMIDTERIKSYTIFIKYIERIRIKIKWLGISATVSR